MHTTEIKKLSLANKGSAYSNNFHANNATVSFSKTIKRNQPSLKSACYNYLKPNLDLTLKIPSSGDNTDKWSQPSLFSKQK